MNDERIKPSRYYWLLHIPYMEIVVLLLISFLGMIFCTILKLEIIATIISTIFNEELLHQLLLASNFFLNFGWKIAVLLIFMETLSLLYQEYRGISVFRSFRLTQYLHRLLVQSLDGLTNDDNYSLLMSKQKKINKIAAASIVVAYKDVTYVFIKLPTEINLRSNLEKYADEAANDIAALTGLRKSGRQSYHDVRRYEKYIYYEMH